MKAHHTMVNGNGKRSAAMAVDQALAGDISFRIRLTLRFLVVAFVAAVLLAFSVGRLCRLVLLEDVHLHARLHSVLPPTMQAVLPHPMIPSGKTMPATTYTSKQFNPGLAANSDSILLARPRESFVAHAVRADGSLPEIDDDYLATLHEPAGEHLLVDIEHVDGAFLNSEERLASAMIELVNLSGLTMLSYHCHELEPMGVTCVGILLESHVSFHTWPAQGVITLDLFTCGASRLKPLVGVIEKLFGIPQPSIDGSPVEPPHTVWGFKKRGFRRGEGGTNPEEVDLNQFLLGWMDYDVKHEVTAIETDFQAIEIYDVINPRFNSLDDYQRSLSGDQSYQARHPELFRPDRVVYLDSIMQSRRNGEGAYHESLVHPAMFAHEGPKRVAIIGGGEGATLRECLKHPIDKVVMVEIDETMVNVSRKYIPEWSDCSNIRGSTPSCFDDPRAEVYYEDAIAWFINRYGDGTSFDEADKFDVIIMDALDPSSVVSFSDVLYNNNELVAALSNALTDRGVFVAQVGETNFLSDPSREFSREAVLDDFFIRQLKENGFAKVHEYEDFHGGFLGVWGYMIAFKDEWTNQRWFAPVALVNLDIRNRLLPSVSAESTLRYFDGATMQGFQYVSRIHEELFCRKNPTPFMCEHGHGYNPNVANVPASSLEVRTGEEEGIFTKVSIANGTYIEAEDAVNSIAVNPCSREVIDAMMSEDNSGPSKALSSYPYATSHYFYGDAGYSLDTSALSFTSHGCNGTYQIGPRTVATEMTASPYHFPLELERGPLEENAWNPFIDRNHMVLLRKSQVTTRPVPAGTPVLGNHLSRRSDNWKWHLTRLRAQCLHQGLAENEHDGPTLR